MSTLDAADLQALVTLAATAAAQGDLEVAYLLYSKSHSRHTSRSQHVEQKNSKAVAGQLQTLAAMCQPPTAPAAAISLGSLHFARSIDQSEYKTSHSSRAAVSSSNINSPQPLPKRWQHMQQRLELGCADNNTSTISSSSNQSILSADSTISSNTNSINSRARRVFCVSDLHVDRAGGANMEWLRSISSSSFKDDVIIVAGEARELQH